MKISAIQRQKKQLDRYSIFIDGVYSFSLSDIGLLESHLAVGQELDKKELAKLSEEAKSDSFYSRVLNFLAIRPRSRWEIETYLLRKKCPDNLKKEILQKLINKGLIDDAKFAAAWIDSRRLLKSVSKRRLISELRAKRISSEVISAAMNDDVANEQTIIKDLVQQKRKITRYQDDKKLMQYLARQGFNYDDIREALRN